MQNKIIALYYETIYETIGYDDNGNYGRITKKIYDVLEKHAEKTYARLLKRSQNIKNNGFDVFSVQRPRLICTEGYEKIN